MNVHMSNDHRMVSLCAKNLTSLSSSVSKPDHMTSSESPACSRQILGFQHDHVALLSWRIYFNHRADLDLWKGGVKMN